MERVERANLRTSENEEVKRRGKKSENNKENKVREEILDTQKMKRKRGGNKKVKIEREKKS